VGEREGNETEKRGIGRRDEERKARSIHTSQKPHSPWEQSRLEKGHVGTMDFEVFF
jgi:hypothetical protein